MRATNILFPLLLLASPAPAGFSAPQQTQVVKLAYGQKSATVVFCTGDGSRVTKARPLCDCTKVRLDGERLVAEVDTSTFDTPVDKQIEATTSDGQRTTLTMQFDVPQAIIITPNSLVWERGAAPTAQEIRLWLPKGSPIRGLISADLSGEDFEYSTRTVTAGQEYVISVRPKTTAGRKLNRLVIRMDGDDVRYRQRILYLRVR